MHMAKVVVKLLNGDYADEGGMIADLGLMAENCRRYDCYKKEYELCLPNE